MNRIERVFLFAVLLFVPVSGSAQISYGRNHPELDWKTIQTPHFQILFHQGLDSLALESAAIAEYHFDRISRDFDVPDMGKTDLILYDADDVANGTANPLNHSIFVYMAGSSKETSDSLRWLDRVIGHEFGHMATFHAARNWLGKPWELLTLGLTPLWYLEGAAQWEAETWDAHRNLFLRLNAVSDALLPYTRLDGFLAADPVDARLVYEQGHGITRYIAESYGHDKVTQIIRSHRSNPLDFGWTLKRTIGKTGGQVYKEWRADLDAFYREASEGREAISEMGRVLDIPLQAVAGVRFNPAGRIAAVGMDRWDEGIQWLVVQRSDGTWKQVGGPHAGGFFSWSGNGTSLIISRKHRGPHGSVTDDLFLVDAESGGEAQLTSGARATDPAWSPVRDEAVCVRRGAGGSSLWILDIPSRNLMELYRPEAGAEIFAPVWSPDGGRIAFSMFDSQGRRFVAVVRRDGSGFRPLTRCDRNARTPFWSPDGEWIVYCDYESGTPNLFRMRPDGSDRIPMTNAAGGLFNPAWLPDGSGIVAVCFERRDSVKAVIIPPGKRVDAVFEMPKPDWAGQEPFPKGNAPIHPPVEAFSAAAPYRSLAHVRPHLALPFAGTDDGGLQLGLAAYAADPLYKHQLLGFLTAGKRADFQVQYTNAQFAPLIRLTLWAATFDQGDHLGVRGARLWERRSGWQLSFSWPFNLGRTLLSNHAVRVWAGSERIQPLHRERFAAFVPAYRPFSGWTHEAGASYAWSWQRPDAGAGIHPVTGAAFSAGISRADALWLSDIERTRIRVSALARQELAWGRHVAAARLTGDWADGDTPVQDLGSLGESMIRGLTESLPGDRFLTAAAEYRLPVVRDIGLKIPFLYFERTTLALWCDAGAAWGRTLDTYSNGARTTLQNVEPVITTGPEFRLRVFLGGKLPVTVRAGYGQGVSGQTGGAWYVRVGDVF